jgi:peptide/nickel transport system substrate-binding protein
VRIAGSATLLPGVLAACGSGSSGSSSAKIGAVTTKGHGAASRAPSKGGVLRIAMIGNGNGETYNPAVVNVPVDFLHAYSVFDPMVRVAPGYKTSPGLVLEWNHNADNTVWELKLRPGVTWHDGKPFTADDIIYTLRGMGSPAHFGYPASLNIRLNDLKKLNDHLVRVPLKTANNRLFDQFIYANMSMVVQDGAKDFSRPVGTGPYKLQSFQPGHQSVLTANRNYWDSPFPYPDELHILSIDDDTARVNALAAGQVDVVNPMPYAQAKAALANTSGAYQILLGAPGRPMTFYMRVDQAPFDDNRVRTAMKLSLDRPALIEAAFSGIGTVANDILGHGLPLYDNSLPQRVQDSEQAKSLLKAAGKSDLRVTLNTAAAFAGQVEAATAFAQQAAKAGITVQLKTQQPANYFNPSLLYLKMGFAQSVWPIASLQSYYSQALLSTGGLNETHFASSAFDKLFGRALAAKSGDEQQARWNHLQKIQYDQGGNIAWINQQSATGYRPNVRGLYLTGSGSGWMYELNDFNVWRWGLA